MRPWFCWSKTWCNGLALAQRLITSSGRCHITSILISIASLMTCIRNRGQCFNAWRCGFVSLSRCYRTSKCRERAREPHLWTTFGSSAKRNENILILTPRNYWKDNNIKSEWVSVCVTALQTHTNQFKIHLDDSYERFSSHRFVTLF